MLSPVKVNSILVPAPGEPSAPNVTVSGKPLATDKDVSARGSSNVLAPTVNRKCSALCEMVRLLEELPANAACWASSVAEASCWVANKGEKAERLANRPTPRAERTPIDQLWPSLALAASDTPSPGPEISSVPPYTNVRQHYRAIPMAGGAGTLPSHSYTKVLDGQFAKDAFKGQTVFVGATAPGFGDILPTPFSGLNQPMSGVEFHANSYSALVKDELISRVSKPIAIGLAVFIIALLSFTLPRMRPARSILLCLTSLGLLALLHALLLVGAKLWLPIDHAADTSSVGASQGVAAHGADVVLELAGHGTLDGPVPRVVDPRCHFVGDQTFGGFKEFKR